MNKCQKKVKNHKLLFKNCFLSKHIKVTISWVGLAFLRRDGPPSWRGARYATRAEWDVAGGVAAAPGLGLLEPLRVEGPGGVGLRGEGGGCGHTSAALCQEIRANISISSSLSISISPSLVVSVNPPK